MHTIKAIGIDPGVDTGFAVWDCEKKEYSQLSTLDFWQVIDLLLEYKNQYQQRLVVVVEDATQNKPTFRLGTNIKENDRKAQNVGSLKRETSLLIEWLDKHKIPYRRIRPSRYTYTKLSAEVFTQITGYQGRSSSHSRDAAMLVFKYI